MTDKQRLPSYDNGTAALVDDPRTSNSVLHHDGAGRAVGIVLWPIALCSLVYRLVQTATGPGYDFENIFNALKLTMEGENPYQVGKFVNPPGVLLLLPFGLLPYSASRLAFHLADCLAIVLALAACLRLFSIDLRSPVAAALVFGVSISFPLTLTLGLDNVNGLILLAELVFLVALTERRTLLAGIAFGIGLAIKPVLLPLLLLPLLMRNGATFIAALVTASVATLGGVLLLSDKLGFVTYALPALLGAPSAEGPTLQEYSGNSNVSIVGAAGILHLDSALVLLLQASTVCAGAFVLWRRWRQPAKDETLQLVEIAAVILLATFLSFTFAWPYYSLYLLPLFVSVVRAGSLLRHPLAWLAVYCIGSADMWSSPSEHVRVLAALRITVGLALLFVVLCAGSLQKDAGTGVRSNVFDVAWFGERSKRLWPTLRSAVLRFRSANP